MTDFGLERSLTERMRAVAEAATEEMHELLKAGGLDPEKDLRFQEWSGCSFRGSKLGGCDFTGARLLSCDFHNASIAGARFDLAEIDWIGGDPGQRADLRAAKDWAEHVASWEKPPKPVGDGHLRVGSAFQDAPFAPEMVVVPAGEFMMGSAEDEEGVRFLSEGPQHKVTISQPFAVGRFAVTFDEWDFAVGEGACRGYKPSAAGWGRGRRPVINLSWDDAQDYIKWLNKNTGKEYRLLSEAEWEYACRAGTTTPFSFGETILTEQAYYDIGYAYGLRKKGQNKTSPVGSVAANAFGLHDMHGNVWEWCADSWHDTYEGAPSDGSARIHGKIAELRVVRGGSWYKLPWLLRSACRDSEPSDYRNVNQGFRVGRAFTP